MMSNRENFQHSFSFGRSDSVFFGHLFRLFLVIHKTLASFFSLSVIYLDFLWSIQTFFYRCPASIRVFWWFKAFFSFRPFIQTFFDRSSKLSFNRSFIRNFNWTFILSTIHSCSLFKVLHSFGLSLVVPYSNLLLIGHSFRPPLIVRANIFHQLSVFQSEFLWSFIQSFSVLSVRLFW